MTRSGSTERGVTSPNGSATQPAGGTVPAVSVQKGWMLPLMVLVAGMFMSILDLSIINVALPTIQNEFGATTDDAQWVVTGYSLAEGVVVPVSAWLGDRFGVTRIYTLALLGFTGGSALCGLTWSLDSLVAFRILQGLLGGVLPAVTMTILLRIVPREKIGSALGLYGLGALVAPAIGPALGGYLVEYVDWRLIFFINLPVGILGAVAALLVLPKLPGRTDRRFDVLGSITVAGGLFALLLALSKGEDWRWDSYRILGLFTFSVLSLALFVVIELEVDDPLLDLRVFRYRAFTHSLVLVGVLSIVLFSVVFYLPQFLQKGQGLGPLDAGLALLPPALVMGALMPLSGQIYDRIGPRWPAVIGLTLAAAGNYLLHTITSDTSREEIVWLLVLQYAGLGISMMPIISAGLAAIPPTYANTASATNNVVQRTSGALGVAVCTAILTTNQAQLLAGRATLMPANTPVPHLGPTSSPGVDLYATYQHADLLAYTGAIDNLFLIFAAGCGLTALGALLLRSGPAPVAAASAAPTPAAPAQQATAPLVLTNDENLTKQPVLTSGKNVTKQPVLTSGKNVTKQPVLTSGKNVTKQPVFTNGKNVTKQPVLTNGKNLTKQPDHTAAYATENSSPARQTDGLVAVGADARSPDY